MKTSHFSSLCKIVKIYRYLRTEQFSVNFTGTIGFYASNNLVYACGSVVALLELVIFAFCHFHQLLVSDEFSSFSPSVCIDKSWHSWSAYLTHCCNLSASCVEIRSCDSEILIFVCCKVGLGPNWQSWKFCIHNSVAESACVIKIRASYHCYPPQVWLKSLVQSDAIARLLFSCIFLQKSSVVEFGHLRAFWWETSVAIESAV